MMRICHGVLLKVEAMKLILFVWCLRLSFKLLFSLYRSTNRIKNVFGTELVKNSIYPFTELVGKILLHNASIKMYMYNCTYTTILGNHPKNFVN